MYSEPVISLSGLSKCYRIYEKPRERLLQMLSFGRKAYGREFWALQNVNLDVFAGEVIGVIGRNGSGKSTLLQLVCGTLSQTHGEVAVHGRIAALLELGAGFNDEFSGRENVFLSASVIGMSHAEIMDRYESIVEFSGIREFIDQPVKTYSSGMYVRLAFAIAIHVDPDILIIDEALSVGDGAFARKSFERIMALKDAGKTILFCSHSLYQVEALCNRVLWLEGGHVRMIGRPAEVVVVYGNEMNAFEGATKAVDILQELSPSNTPSGAILSVTVSVDGEAGIQLKAKCRQSSIDVNVEFRSDPQIPAPSVAVGFTLTDGTVIAGTSTKIAGIHLELDRSSKGAVTIHYDNFPLLKNKYLVVVYLMCERGVHVYDHALNCATISVTQDSLEQGIISLEHKWSVS